MSAVCVFVSTGGEERSCVCLLYVCLCSVCVFVSTGGEERACVLYVCLSLLGERRIAAGLDTRVGGDKERICSRETSAISVHFNVVTACCC